MAQSAYATPQQAVDALRPGWKIVGQRPYEVELPNPAKTPSNPGAPATVKQTLGTILSIEGPDGAPDEMTVSTLTALPSTTTGGAKGGVGYTVLQGPSKGPPAGSNKPSDPSKWLPVYRPGTTDVVGAWDPVNNEMHPIAAPPDAKPSGTFDPVMVKDANGTERQVGMVDTGDKSFHPLAAPPQAQPSGKYDNVEVTNADGTKRVVGMVDQGDKSFHPLAADPTTGRQIVTTPKKIFVFDNNGKVTNEVDVATSSPYQAVVIDGVPYQFNPNEPDPTKAFTKAPGDWQHPPIKDANQNPMIWQTDADGGGKYVYPPGVSPAATLQTNTTAKTLDWYGPNGELIKSVQNPNYQAPKVDAATPPPTNTVAKRILIPDPEHPGSLKWIDNEARVTASQALQNLASQLSGQVVSGDISVDEAKVIIDNANQAMTTAATAAGQQLSAIASGAQTGAGLLNQRVQAAQGFVNQGLGLLGQTKHGLLVAPDSSFASNLVQGAAGFATDLGGGPEVYQAAANLVRRADPNSAMGGDAAAAYATLTQMFQKYRATHGGQPAPEETAALQGNQGGAQGTGQQAAAGPVQTQTQATPTLPAQLPAEAAGIAAPARAVPGQNYGAATAYTNGVAPWNAGPQSFQAPGQNYGAATAYTGGIAPWNAVPGPSFVAAPMAPSPPAPQPFVAAGMAPITPQNRNITITVPTA